jgi:hypothetical protein
MVQLLCLYESGVMRLPQSMQSDCTTQAERKENP